MTFVFKHPKYYKELRKRNKSDQAISDHASTEVPSVRPGQGLKPQAASFKLQAASYKLQDLRTTEKFHGAWIVAQLFRGSRQRL